MNRVGLIAAVADQAQLTKKDAKKAVEAVFSTISNSLTKGDKVRIIGFGTFEVRDRKGREGRNPHTNEPIQIEASKTPAFKAGKQLKDLVNGK
ncbi:HU family DNA-binding protein [Megasphaera sp.]|uniref:HU family DNA-binding protein n=1 Tax=Megasphaera sp. TaxID=2023260 RepID=UPI003FF12C6E